LKNDTAFTGNVTGGWNTLNLAANSVDSAKIVDGSIGAADLASSISLGGSQSITYGSGTINANQLNGQVSSYYLNTGTAFGGNVTGTYNALQLAAGSVNSTAIMNGVINSSKLVADLNLGWANLTNYPTDCGIGYAVTGFNDTDLKCASMSAGTIGGGGTTNVIAKFTGDTTIGNSTMYESSEGFVGVNTTTPQNTLEVVGL